MSVLIAIIVFSVLVIIHEFGHFLIAKKNGICVTEFALGMGPKLLHFKKGETTYCLNLVPFGGYCQMLGMDPTMESEDEKDNSRSFQNKSIWARISVVCGGPVFNFLLAFVLALIVIGFVGADVPEVTSVEEGSAASEAGLKKGDLITSYNGTSVSIGREIYLQDYVSPLTKDDVKITVKRDGKKKVLRLRPDEITKYMYGMQYSLSDESITITVAEGSALEAAGIKTGDQVVSINGTEFRNAKEMGEYFEANPLSEESTASFVVKRNKKTITANVTPKEVTYYDLGFSYNLGRKKQNALGALKYSCFEIKYQIKTVFKSLGMLFNGKLTKDDVSGPVGIVDMISDTVNDSKSDGWFFVLMNVLNMTILLSANLGVMNLLPLPALDGGRLAFLLIELILGKPVPKEKEGMVHFVGMVLLMILMVFILFNDIGRLFR